MKLWIKISILNGIIVVSLGLLIGLALRSIVTTSMRDELTRQGKSISRNLSDRLSDLVLLDDFYTAQQSISDVLKKEQDIEYIYITNQVGQVFVHTFSKGFPPDILHWNPLLDKSFSIQLLDTEKGYIRDLGLKIFEGMPIDLHIGIREARIRQTLKRIRNVIIGLTVSVTLMGAVLSSVFCHFLTKPLYKLVDFAKLLSKGEFGKKVEVESKSEIGYLGKTINELSVELKIYKQKMEESYRKMLRTEKLTALGRLSAGLAHELRNPLTSLKVLFQTLRNNPKLAKEDISIVLSEVDQMDGLLSKFLNFSKREEFNLEEVDINKIIKQVLNLTRFQMENQSIKQNTNFSEFQKIKVDRSMIEQVFMNLILNAIESMPDGGSLDIASSLNNEYVVVQLKDSGNGIPEEMHEKVFDPFFTTKNDGTGLGLSIVYNIVNLHKGDINLTSNREGTTITLKFPVEI
jgi:signal transduction histidine kinase